jgi:hypothetical protein
MKIKLQKTKTINGELFRLSIITEDYYFYSNYREGDTNANTLMYNRKTDNLISNNYFAYTAIEECLEQKDYTWASKYIVDSYNRFIKAYE